MDVRFVFRCFAADGTLLYVGLSQHVFMQPPRKRRRQLHWWPTVARVTWEEWPDRFTAARAQAEAMQWSSHGTTAGTRRAEREIGAHLDGSSSACGMRSAQ